MSSRTALKRSLLVVVTALGCMTARAQSLTMTFDDVAGLNRIPAAYGVQFQNSMGLQYLLSGPSYMPGYATGNVFGYYALTGVSQTMTLLQPQASFALRSLDISGVYAFMPGERLTIAISGVRTDNTVVSASHLFGVTQGQVSSYGPADFIAFTGLRSLTFSGVSGNNARYVALDNIAITVSPVPEPRSLAMVLGGLALLAAFAARRRQRM